MTNIRRRAKTGIYVFRKTVPPELRAHFGKREIIISLHTKDHKEAKLRQPAIAAQVESEIARMRASLTPAEASVPESWVHWFQDRSAASVAFRPASVTFTILPENYHQRVATEAPGEEKQQHTASWLLEEVLAELTSETLEPKYRLANARFIEINGDMNLRNIKKAHVLSYKQALLAKKLKPLTINHCLDHLMAQFTWAIDHEFMSPIITKGLKLKIDKRAKGRTAFNDDDLKALFASPPKEERDFWMQSLALHGSRLSEIAQLRPCDVFEENGVWCMYHTPEAGRLKNASSERKVPLHDDVLSAGFLEFLKSRAGKEQLFEFNTGRGALNWSQEQFSNYKRKCGITGKKSFHSFRHTFKDLCIKFGVPEEAHDAITGRTGGGSGRGYGSGWTVEAKKREMDRIRFPMPVPKWVKRAIATS